MTTTSPQPPGPGQRELGRTAVSRLYRGQTHYDFINRWKIWFALSGLVIVVGMAALAIGGLNFSIDFKGGTEWQVPTSLSPAAVKTGLGPLYSKLDQPVITTLTNKETGQPTVQIKAPAKITSDNNLVTQVTDKLTSIAHLKTSNDINVEAVGPTWGNDVSSKAIEAVVVFLVLISLCIAAYFETKMAAAALVALLHDILVTVGIYALSGFQVSPDTVIAFLTVMGYSLYDTIVVFDKVKENTRGLASTNKFTYTDVVNVSMNQVLARSVNTSFVAIMPVFCILVIGSWIMGASALNDFGLALFIGLMSGAYSSIFIASPILALLKEREPRYAEIRRKLDQYPQARQYLTPSTVAGGSIISRPRPGSPAPAPVDGFLAGNGDETAVPRAVPTVPSPAGSRNGAPRPAGAGGARPGVPSGNGRPRPGVRPGSPQPRKKAPPKR
jgi:preprotein translocase subunit SecF